MGSSSGDDEMDGDWKAGDSDVTNTDPDDGDFDPSTKASLKEQPSSKPKRFDNGRGRRETWSVAMYLVLLKHLSYLKGPENPLRNPKTRLEECENIGRILKADVDKDQLNVFTAAQIKSKIEGFPLRLTKAHVRNGKSSTYNRDELYRFGPAVVSLPVIMPNFKLHLEDEQQHAYERHEDPFEVEEDVDESDAEAPSDAVAAEKDENAGAPLNNRDKAMGEAGDEAGDEGGDEEERIEDQNIGDSTEHGRPPAELGFAHRRAVPTETIQTATSPVDPSKPRSLIVKLAYKKKRSAPETSIPSDDNESLEHISQAHSKQDEIHHVSKRRKLEETDKAVEQSTKAAEQPSRASAQHLNDTTTGVQQPTPPNQEGRAAPQRAGTVPAEATHPSSIPDSDTTPQSTPGLNPSQDHEHTISPTNSSVDALKMRLANLGRNRLKSKAPLHDFGERMEEIGKKIIRAVRSRADGAGVQLDRLVSTADIDSTAASGPMETLFLSLTGMMTKAALGEIIRADQQDPLRLSELVCAMIGAAVAEWALMPSVFSSQSQKLLDSIRALLSSQHEAGANKALEAGTDMLLEEARKIHIEQDVSPNIGKTACDLRDDLIEILSPLLSNPRSNVDPSMRAALAHAPSASSASSRPQRGQSVFPRQAWLYTWEADLNEIFAAALKLRAEMETAGGNYEFVWPRLAESICLEGLSHDAMILLPMLPQLKGQCQSMYAGPMGELEVVFAGQVFWR